MPIRNSEDSVHSGVIVGKDECGWAGCSHVPEATLDTLPWCRTHFYSIAAKRLSKYRAHFSKMDTTGTEENVIRKFLSEVIAQTTALLASAKFLAPSQREQFLELSMSAAEFSQRFRDLPHASAIVDGGTSASTTKVDSKFGVSRPPPGKR